MEHTHKIEAAAASTTAIEGAVGKASQILQDGFTGRIINGYGVYTDRTARARDLRAARALIDHALAVMDETAWPTRADYDRAEG